MSKKTRPESVVYPKHFKPWELEPYYSIHVSAMTSEQLHDKADIAEQLAWRDREIARLRDEVAKLAYAPEPDRGAPEPCTLPDCILGAGHGGPCHDGY